MRRAIPASCYRGLPVLKVRAIRVAERVHRAAQFFAAEPKAAASPYTFRPGGDGLKILREYPQAVWAAHYHEAIDHESLELVEA